MYVCVCVYIYILYICIYIFYTAGGAEAAREGAGGDVRDTGGITGQGCIKLLLSSAVASQFLLL